MRLAERFAASWTRCGAGDEVQLSVTGRSHYNGDMFEAFLVPEKTVVTAKGDGTAVDCSGAAGKTLLVTLNITRIVEQESLDVSIWSSTDGTTYSPKPVLAFPQKFYTGEHPLLMDVPADAKFLRAHWEVNRWGRGSEAPMFEFQVSAREVPAELLKEAQAEAAARR